MAELEVAYLEHVASTEVEVIYADDLTTAMPELDPLLLDYFRQEGGWLVRVPKTNHIYFQQGDFNAGMPVLVADLRLEDDPTYGGRRLVASGPLVVPEGMAVAWSSTCIICGDRFERERLYHVCSQVCDRRHPNGCYQIDIDVLRPTYRLVEEAEARRLYYAYRYPRQHEALSGEQHEPA